MECRIEEVNRQMGFKIVSYDGCLSGNEYATFLAKCDIGICTRFLDDSMSNYTFPSKVFGIYVKWFVTSVFTFDMH